MSDLIEATVCNSAKSSATKRRRLLFPPALLRAAAFLFLVAAATLPGQEQAAPQVDQAKVDAAKAATLVKMTAVRDQVIAKIHAAGFTCPIAAPTIVVEDVPSFGQYADETNTLRTTDWTIINPHERAFMVQLAGPGADEAAVQDLFEKAAHGWIFVHELGHWWQACRGYIATHSHYEVEAGANRISLAYWRENDPSVVTLMMRLFNGILEHQPSPVPAGQKVEDYFNSNYEQLGPTPLYPWFQARMSVTDAEEKPVPSFAAVLAAVKK